MFDLSNKLWSFKLLPSLKWKKNRNYNRRQNWKIKTIYLLLFECFRLWKALATFFHAMSISGITARCKEVKCNAWMQLFLLYGCPCCNSEKWRRRNVRRELGAFWNKIFHRVDSLFKNNNSKNFVKVRPWMIKETTNYCEFKPRTFLTFKINRQRARKYLL